MAGEWLNAGLPPRPQQSGYREQRVDYSAVFQPEQGPPKVRRAHTARRRQVSAIYRVNQDVMRRFRSFDEAMGTWTLFEMPDPLWDDSTGDPDEVSARFTSPIQIAAVSGTIYDVVCEFEVKR